MLQAVKAALAHAKSDPYNEQMVHLEPELQRDLQQVATLTGRSAEEHLREAVNAHVRRIRERYGTPSPLDATHLLKTLEPQIHAMQAIIRKHFKGIIRIEPHIESDYETGETFVLVEVTLDGSPQEVVDSYYSAIKEWVAEPVVTRRQVRLGYTFETQTGE